jgi:hypothetical protein
MTPSLFSNSSNYKSPLVVVHSTWVKKRPSVQAGARYGEVCRAYVEAHRMPGCVKPSQPEQLDWINLFAND